MKKNKQRFVALILMLLLAVGTNVTSKAAETKKQNRYNVVFVTDESGSMRSTDPDGLRYEAIKRFVGLTAQEGNYLGSVSFNNKIVSQQVLQAVEGIDNKESFANKIIAKSGPGYTNIGAGLKKAVNSLNKNRNKTLPSAIVLLTDGNTEMKSDDETQESLKLKAEAIEQARKAGYKIYTICLNKDGSADASEMKQIATATGGKFTEVKNSKDLADVETVYYKMIFGSADGGDGNVIISKNGSAEIKFKVPEVGVEEINLIFEGNYSTCEVIDPSGHKYSDQELQKMLMKGKGYSIAKIQAPKAGIWKAKIKGNAGARIKYKLLYNSSFSIKTSVNSEENYGIGDNVEFRTQICDSKGVVKDNSKYKGFSAKLHITVNQKEQTYDMKLDQKGFVYKYKIPKEGTYYAKITVTDGKMSADSGKAIELNVNNRAPVASKDQPSAHANIWPIIGGSASLDLKDTAKDPDKEKLTYSVESSAFNKEDYTLDGNVLKVSHFSIPKGSFTIKATDPHGAYCTYDVMVTSTNIGLIMAIGVCVGTLLVLIILGVIIYKKRFIPFMGTITVEKYDQESNEYMSPVSITPGRGSIRLESFVSGTGLPAGCKFQAGGKDKNIYFTSKKPVYSDYSTAPVKKIKIEGNGLEIRISSDEKKEKGILVKFESILYNQFF